MEDGSTSSDPVPGDAHILLVEDNDDDIYFTRRALEASGIEPDRLMVVRDGAEALDYLFAQGAHEGRDVTDQPKLILLDVNLPRLSGIEVLQRLREDARTRRLPVVMLTSSNEDRDVVESYTAGANSYIQKPVDHQSFRTAIETLARYWLDLNVFLG